MTDHFGNSTRSGFNRRSFMAATAGTALAAPWTARLTVFQRPRPLRKIPRSRLKPWSRVGISFTGRQLSQFLARGRVRRGSFGNHQALGRV